jgi:hypothetical protein
VAKQRYGPSKARIKNKYRAQHQKEPMLNLRAVMSFKYYLEPILEESTMKEDFVNAFTANLITKASRVSLREAKDYVRSIAEQGIFEERTCREICDLLDRHRKYR